MGRNAKRKAARCKRNTYLFRSLDVLHEEGYFSWVKSLSKRRPGKVNSQRNRNREDGKLHERYHENAIIKLQSHIRGYVARKHYKSLMTEENPPLSTIRYFSRFLDPFDPQSIDQQQRLNALKHDFTSKCRAFHQQGEELQTLERDIAALVKGKMALKDLGSQLKKLKLCSQKQIKKVTTEQRQKAQEVIKNRERLESYGQLFYHLQTNPVYLARLIDQMSNDQDIRTITNKLFFKLYNHSDTPREEYYFVKLMEFALRQEVERKIDAVEDILRGKSKVLKIILQFYLQKSKCSDLVKALTPAFLKILKITYALTPNPDKLAAKHFNLVEGMEGVHGVSAGDENIDLYDMTNEIIECIFSSVDRIPYGLRYLTKVLQQSLLKKFPEVGKELVLRTVGFFFSMYLWPAIEKPNIFGLIEPKIYEGSIQKENLKLLSVIVSLAIQSFAVKKAYAPGMYDYVSRTSPGFRKFFRDLLNVSEPEDKFQLSKFSDAIEIPQINMLMGDIFYTHSLLSKYKNVVFGDHGHLQTMDIAYQVFKGLGPVSHLMDLLDTDGAFYDEANKVTRIWLCLHSKVSPLGDFDSEMENLKISTQKLVLNVIPWVPGETLQKVLRPASPAQEKDHIMGDTTSTGTNFPDKMKNSSSTEALEYEKQKIIANLQTLQKAGLFTEERSHQEILNLISQEMKGRHDLRQKRNVELTNIEQALAELRYHSKFLQDSIDLYKSYRKSCIDNVLCRKSDTDGVIQKIHYVEDTIKYTAKKLLNKGVVVDTHGEFRQLKREVLRIKTGGDGYHIRLDKKHVFLPIVDILRLYHSSEPTMKIFHYDVDVGMFLLLVFSKLHKM
ncbi:ras GTPase-activating-like protein IQGAP2 [Aquarana catesbeiana]|uniref:ras GTPase-activating-like protein IQGAP2 n=1 Tax=Aquarana catesbeiana TaxID=8400 RepID=UPI003CC9AC33